MEPQARTTSEWPGAFGIYRTAKEATKVNIWTIVALYIISALIGFVLSTLFGKKLEWLAQLIDILVSVWITAAVTLTLIKSVAHEPIATGKALKAASPRYADMFIVTVLTWIAYVVSFALLIVPFFFVFPRLVLAPYLVMDKKLGAIDALKASWHSTKGNVGKVYGITGAAIAYALLFLTIIGIPFAIYLLFMYSTSTAVLYRHITGQPLAYLSKGE